jgi:FKBP-type peptidyl-prolyl cis-trans isomerase FkpA
MSATLRRALLVLLAGAPLACGDGGGEPQDEAAAPVTDPAELTYAAELQVDLAAMSVSETGLYTRTLREGTGSEAAAPGDSLGLHYTGWLPDGTRFDSSRDGDPFEIVLGVTPLIQGWPEGVEGMVEGEVRQLVIPPDLAYGARGAGTVIPPGATLVFEVELVSRRAGQPPGA